MSAAAPLYSRFAQRVADASGRPSTFAAVILLTVTWAMTGPLFHFSDTWQLVMNTASSIVTFLMVFIIQNTQNRQSEAMQIKLDELIRSTRGAHNALLDLEELDDRQLRNFRLCYERLAEQARARLDAGEPDTGNDSDTQARPDGE